MFSAKTLSAIERCAVSHIVTVLTICKCSVHGSVGERVASIIVDFCDDMICDMRNGVYPQFDAQNGLDAFNAHLLNYTGLSAQSRIVHHEDTTWDEQMVMEAMEYIVGYINKDTCRE